MPSEPLAWCLVSLSLPYPEVRAGEQGGVVLQGKNLDASPKVRVDAEQAKAAFAHREEKGVNFIREC